MHLLVGFFFSYLSAAELRTSVRAFAAIPNNYRLQATKRKLCYSCTSDTEQPMPYRHSLHERAKPYGQHRRYFHRFRKSCLTPPPTVQRKAASVQAMKSYGTAEEQLHLLTSALHVGECSSQAPRNQPRVPPSAPQTGIQPRFLSHSPFF
jgi:hypothetical protein